MAAVAPWTSGAQMAILLTQRLEREGDVHGSDRIRVVGSKLIDALKRIVSRRFLFMSSVQPLIIRESTSPSL